MDDIHKKLKAIQKLKTGSAYDRDVHSNEAIGNAIVTADAIIDLILRYTNNTQEIFTTKAGNDTTGDGSRSLPYLTVTKANTEADQFTAIYVGSGNYDEEIDITKHNITLIGEDDTIFDTTTNGGTSLTWSGTHGIMYGGAVDYSGSGATTYVANITGEGTKIYASSFFNSNSKAVTDLLRAGNQNGIVEHCHFDGNSAATNGINTYGTNILFRYNDIQEVTVGILGTAAECTFEKNSISATTGYSFPSGGDYNKAFGDVFNCTTDVTNAGTGNIVIKAADLYKTGFIYPTKVSGTKAYDETSAAEQTVVEDTTSGLRKLTGIWLDMVNVTQTTTIKLYHKIDGTNYRQFDSKVWTTVDDDGVEITPVTVDDDFKITFTCGGGGGGGVNVPYSLI